MPTKSLHRLLSRLEQYKSHYGLGTARQVEGLLAILARHSFTDPALLLRFHEALLFLRAFPQGPGVVRATENVLKTFCRRVEQLKASSANLSVFEDFDGAGVAGTEMEDVLNFDVARWLARRIPRSIEIAWEGYEEERAMGEAWPRFIPLLEDDAYVEANIPWLRWLRTAKGRERDFEWLLRRFEQLPMKDRDKAELYNGLRLPVRWNLANVRWSRTRNWRRPRTMFYHREPLITRAQVSLKEELARPGPELKKLTLQEGKRVMETIREVMAVRYRELYGTTLGDPHSVVAAELGRGVEMYFWNLPPQRRLPLRAYVAGFTLKNGVPINYVEAIGLCEWMEVGFNTFYTFRNGETAWIYAQSLRCLRRLTGTKCISVYPYQIGQNNEEAIESGAFWFYRKLGFRPGRKDLLRLAEREEEKIAAREGYRTPPHILRQLAETHVFYELPGSEPGAWDRFSTRNLGLRVNRRMAREFAGQSERVRQASEAAVRKALGIQTSRWTLLEQRAFSNWALVLAMVPGLHRWTRDEKTGVAEIVRAQAGHNEVRYLQLTQRHPRLRHELLRLGSRVVSEPA